jgi:hypothetical protein
MRGGHARYSAGPLFFVLVFDFFYFEELAQEKTKDFRAFNDNNFHEKDPLNLN